MRSHPNSKLEILQREISLLERDSALLYLNRQLTNRTVRPSRAQDLPHVSRYLARLVLIHASTLGIRELNRSSFSRLANAVIQLDDPIQHDPDWDTKDPGGFFERILHQQIKAQEQITMQMLGLGLGLFSLEYSALTTEGLAISRDLSRILQVPVDQFIQFAFLAFCSSTQVGARICRGAFTPNMFVDAYLQGFAFCIPEVWRPFLHRLSLTPNGFREMHSSSPHFCVDHIHDPFALNLLSCYPIVNLEHGRYLAIDPQLVLERATLGLYHDLLTHDGMDFTTRFGDIFSSFVGALLHSVLPAPSFTSDKSWKTASPRKAQPKHADWAYEGEAVTVLIECKTMRPTLELLTTGSDEAFDKVVDRLGQAVSQLSQHSHDIAAGRWLPSLRAQKCIGIIVTYGRFFTANHPNVRRRIRTTLSSKGDEPLSYVVLSLEELDSLAKLVETGHRLEDVVDDLARDDTTNRLRSYDALHTDAVSSFTRQRTMRFIDQLRCLPSALPRGLPRRSNSGGR